MLDNQNAASLPPNANDGTLEGAAAAMQDVDVSNLMSFDEAANRNEGLPPPPDMAKARDQSRQSRSEDGKFQSPNAEALAALPPNHNQAPAEDEAAEGDVLADLESQFFELPPEKDGDEPVRLTAKQVFEGYQEREQLRRDLEAVKRVAPPPQEWDRQMYETVQTRGQLVQMLNTIAQAYAPQEPDMRLIDPNNPNQDPALFYHQKAAFDAARMQIQRVAEERQRQEQALAQERNALSEAGRLREMSKLKEFWPEIADPSVQREVRDYAARTFGITDHDFKTIHDSRFYAILKKAKAFDDAQSQRQTAVKIVRSAPKLVKAPARNTQGRGQQAYSTSMQRLQRSGSIEDAANAIGGLLG